jgi:hypothetical protein
MKKLFILTLLATSLVACEKSNNSKAVALFAPPPVKPDQEVLTEKTENIVAVEVADNKMFEPAANSENTPETALRSIRNSPKKIIKEGSIEFETRDMNKTRKRIFTTLQKYNGYVEEDNQSTNSDVNRKEYTLKIKIPAVYFDHLIDSVSSAADKIDHKNISVTDVTTKYIDINTRLDNKKILENRYLQLLKQSSKVSELLQIENKLADIRSDIESVQGQLNYLNSQVAYSSLDITFYTQSNPAVDKSESFGYKFSSALSAGLNSLQTLFFVLVAFWPYLTGGSMVYAIVRKWRGRRTLNAA